MNGLPRKRVRQPALAAEKLAAVTAEEDRLAEEKEAAEKEAAARLAAVMAEEDRLAEEKEAAEREAAEKLAVALAEEERLAAEKEAAEKEAAEKLAAAMAEEERLAAEKEAADREAAEKLAAAMAEEERLAAEKEAAEKEAAERLAAVMAEEEKLAAEKEAAEKEAAQKLAAVIAEEERLATEYSVAKKEQISSAYDPADPFAFMETDRTSRGSSANGDAAASPARFSVDKTMKTIDYCDPAEIVEVHRSLNMARITPDGKSPENSCAFIIALKKNGDLRVYVPCLLSESGNILTYVPDRQPENPDDLAAIIQNAVDFIETVGFMMEPVSLSTDPKARASALQFIPVLSLINSEPRDKGLAA